MKILNRSFYARDTDLVARELLGKIIVRELDGYILKARIAETEAYMGIADLAGAAERLLGFQPIHHGLDSGVGRSVLGPEAFLNLTDGGGPGAPQHLHDLHFQLA